MSSRAFPANGDSTPSLGAASPRGRPRLPHSGRLVQDPAEARAGLVRKCAQVLQSRPQLGLGGARKPRECPERALDDVGRVVRLTRQVLVLPPERLLAVVDLAEAGLAEPLREPRAGVAPARGRHAL